MATAGLTGLALLMMLVAYSTRTAAGAILVALLWRSNSRYSHGVSKIPIVLSDYGVLKSPKHRHKAGSGSRLRVGGKAKGSEKDRHAHTCKAGRQAPAWMGQNLILLVEERMLDGCLDESTKARYQFKSP